MPVPTIMDVDIGDAPLRYYAVTAQRILGSTTQTETWVRVDIPPGATGTTRHATQATIHR